MTDYQFEIEKLKLMNSKMEAGIKREVPNARGVPEVRVTGSETEKKLSLSQDII